MTNLENLKKKIEGDKETELTVFVRYIDNAMQYGKFSEICVPWLDEILVCQQTIKCDECIRAWLTAESEEKQ